MVPRAAECQEARAGVSASEQAQRGHCMKCESAHGLTRDHRLDRGRHSLSECRAPRPCGTENSDRPAPFMILCHSLRMKGASRVSVNMSARRLRLYSWYSSSSSLALSFVSSFAYSAARTRARARATRLPRQ